VHKALTKDNVEVLLLFNLLSFIQKNNKSLKVYTSKDMILLTIINQIEKISHNNRTNFLTNCFKLTLLIITYIP
jgi:hypothetical protein